MFLCGNFALEPLQTGEIMSSNKITQFSYFYWNTNEKKAGEKTTLFHYEICHDCDIAWCLWKNASWDIIRSSSGKNQSLKANDPSRLNAVKRENKVSWEFFFFGKWENNTWNSRNKRAAKISCNKITVCALSCVVVRSAFMNKD